MEIPSAKITGSLIYEDIIIMECDECGHVFNHLAQQEIENLKPYYKREYIEGRYTKTDMQNSFLGAQYGNNCAIVTQDDIKNYIDMLVNINGDLYNDLWPERDFIALDQFLEHCWNLDAVMQYIRKTLPPGGRVYISVPDYDEYDNLYYYLIKEHIHHFTHDSIMRLFNKHGLSEIEHNHGTLDILGGELQLPIIEYVFVNNIKSDGVYCYGAGRELLYMLNNNEYFVNNAIDGIIDDTVAKQNKKIDGIPIVSSSIIQDLSDASTIIITAYYSKGKIRDKLFDVQYKGTIKTPDSRWDV
jgi:hypothetical protein